MSERGNVSARQERLIVALLGEATLGAAAARRTRLERLERIVRPDRPTHWTRDDLFAALDRAAAEGGMDHVPGFRAAMDDLARVRPAAAAAIPPPDYRPGLPEAERLDL